MDAGHNENLEWVDWEDDVTKLQQAFAPNHIDFVDAMSGLQADTWNAMSATQQTESEDAISAYIGATGLSSLHEQTSIHPDLQTAIHAGVRLVDPGTLPNPLADARRFAALWTPAIHLPTGLTLFEGRSNADSTVDINIQPGQHIKRNRVVSTTYNAYVALHFSGMPTDREDAHESRLFVHTIRDQGVQGVDFSSAVNSVEGEVILAPGCVFVVREKMVRRVKFSTSIETRRGFRDKTTDGYITIIITDVYAPATLPNTSMMTSSSSDRFDHLMSLDDEESSPPRRSTKRSIEDEEEKKMEPKRNKYPTVDQVKTNQDEIQVVVTADLLAQVPVLRQLHLFLEDTVTLPPLALDVLHTLDVDPTTYSDEDLVKAVTFGHAFEVDIKEWLEVIIFRVWNNPNPPRCPWNVEKFIEPFGSEAVRIELELYWCKYYPKIYVWSSEIFVSVCQWLWQASGVGIGYAKEYLKYFLAIVEIGNLSLIRELRRLAEYRAAFLAKPDRALAIAIEENHVKVFKLLFHDRYVMFKNAPGDRLDRVHWVLTALSQERERYEIVEFLLQKQTYVGSDYDKAPQLNQSHVDVAIRTGNMKLIKLILKQTVLWLTAIPLDSASLNIEILELVLANAPTKVSVDLRGAIIKKDERLIAWALQTIPNRIYIGHDPSCYIRLAIQEKNFKMVRFLRSIGLQWPTEETHYRNLLLESILTGDVEMTEWIIQDARRAVWDSHFSMLAAVKSGNPAMVLYVMKQCGPVHPRLEYYARIAARANNLPVLRILYQYCASRYPNQEDTSHKLQLTAELFRAAVKCDNDADFMEMMTWLVLHKCQKNAQVMNEAIKRGKKLEFIKWLRDSNCPYDDDSAGLAARYNTFPVVQYLIGIGASPDALEELLNRADVELWQVQFMVNHGALLDEDVALAAFGTLKLDIIRYLIKDAACPYLIKKCIWLVRAKPANPDKEAVFTFIRNEIGYNIPKTTDLPVFDDPLSYEEEYSDGEEPETLSVDESSEEEEEEEEEEYEEDGEDDMAEDSDDGIVNSEDEAIERNYTAFEQANIANTIPIHLDEEETQRQRDDEQYADDEAERMRDEDERERGEYFDRVRERDRREREGRN
jgi:hypothetical protein